MVKAFIKPMNKDRNLGNFLYRYLIEPPLLYYNEPVIDLSVARISDLPTSHALPEIPPQQNPALEVEKKHRPNRKHYIDRLNQGLRELSEPSPVHEKNPIKISFADLLTRAYIVTYGFEGFDHTINQLVFADHNGENRVQTIDQKRDISTWVLIASFFGLPTRPSRAAAADAKPVTKLGVQLLRNAIGGWEPLYESTDPAHPIRKRLIWTEKKVWQMIALFTVKPIILLLKLISIPFKLTLNILKLFTEWLPAIATSLFAAWFLNTLDTMRHIASKRINPFSKGLQLLALGVLTLTLGVLNYTSRILTLIGRAATSPEKSARIAYAAFSEYKINGRTEDETQTFSKIFGFMGGLMSVLISMTVWTLTLPLAIGAFMTYVPVYFPTAYQFLGSIAQLPVITKSLAILNNALAPVGRAIIIYAGPALSTISTFLSVNIPTTALIIGTAIGALAAPLTAIISRLADEFSNAWASWFKGANGPVTATKAWFKRHSSRNKNRDPCLLESDPEPIDALPPSTKTQDQIIDELQPHFLHFGALTIGERGQWAETWATLSDEGQKRWLIKWGKLEESQRKNWSEAWKYWEEPVASGKTRFSLLGIQKREEWLNDWLALRDPRPLPKRSQETLVNPQGQTLVMRKRDKEQDLFQQFEDANNIALRAENDLDGVPPRTRTASGDIELVSFDRHDAPPSDLW